MKNTEYILPFRDSIIHPGATIPLYIENPDVIACVHSALAGTRNLVLVPQRNNNFPAYPDDLFDIGTLGEIVEEMNMPDGSIEIIMRTKSVVKVADISLKSGIFSANVTPVKITDDIESELTQAMQERLVHSMKRLSELTHKMKKDALNDIMQNCSLPGFVDAIVRIVNPDIDVKISVLRATSWQEKLEILLTNVTLLLESIKMDKTIDMRVQKRLEAGHREALLHEKMRVIRQELGENDEDTDLDIIKNRIEKSDMPNAVKEKAMSEWRRMRNMSPMSAEGGVLRTYLEELLTIPWGAFDKTDIDLARARNILDSQHSGMMPVKERILEHIAVMKKTGNNRGSILCLVGAPGVGKTSLGKSVADALGRKYMRISLGGVADEAHFRGHRKTYVGAQMGRVMDAIRRCKTSNPVIVLDEIDKMGSNWRCDSEAALLEILDPEQNRSFRDHYLEVDFDLSNVLFIATANSLNLSSALKDRMEIIEIPGYTMDEKINIARDHLITRAALDTGWDKNNITMSDDAIRHIIQNYTTEQGVRQLQREITAILRRTLLENDGVDAKTEFTSEKIDSLLSLYKNAGFSKRIGFGVRV